MGEFSAWHWLIVVGVLVLLFGANKLPQMARSLGQSMRIFRSETRAMRTDQGEQQPLEQGNQQASTGQGSQSAAAPKTSTAGSESASERSTAE
jgi:sec-independent protein translocase protein TatA